MPVVKVCCIQSIEEVKLTLQYGVDAVGLVADMPTGLRMISDAKIKSIVSEIKDKDLKVFLLTSRYKTSDILNHLEYTQANTLQLVDFPEIGTYDKIREDYPGIDIVQVLHVTGEETIEQALKLDGHVDYFLLDSGNPGLEKKVLGGTGKTHNWDISARLVKAVKTPVYLAGGLSPDNLQEAIETVMPYGVDVCSGLRDPINLEEDKLRRFMEVAMKYN